MIDDEVEMALLLATSNPHKARSIQALLERPVTHIVLAIPEIQAVDVTEVIEAKARAAYQLVSKPVLVEDSGLAIHAWRGLPGALIRWFLDTVGNDGICTMLQGYTDTTATAETCLGFYDGTVFHAFSGKVEGQIARQPRGHNGFGWDPLFIPHGYEKTFAEMEPAESAAVSMRRIAVLKLRDFLNTQGI